MLFRYYDIVYKPSKLNDHASPQFAIFDIAIMDVLQTIIFAYLLSYFFKKKFHEVAIALFLLGIIAHRIFCIRTTIDKLIFYE